MDVVGFALDGFVNFLKNKFKKDKNVIIILVDEQEIEIIIK